LELELGALPREVQRIPSDLMDLSVEIGHVARETDKFLLEKAKITSPLLKVQSFERSQEWTEKLRSLLLRVNGRCETLVQELKQLDAQWNSTGPRALEHSQLLERLDSLYRLFSYSDRWQAQIQERMVPLSF